MAPTPKEPAKKASKSTGKAKAESTTVVAPPEKRTRRYVSSANAGVRERLARAYSQKLYLVNQVDNTSVEHGIGMKFAVMGTTGNIYDVAIDKEPTCNCPDCARGNKCKHIIFVMVRVLQVPVGSGLIYQNALLQSELASIFGSAPALTQGVLANPDVLTAYRQNIVGEVDDKPKETDQKVPEGECPVCFDSLTGKEALDSCSTCRNFIHKECLKNWLKVRPTCCYCRAAWHSYGSASGGGATGAGTGAVAAAGRPEGYVNLGAMQGLSGRRDTSTYHSRRYYGYDGGEDDF